MRHLLIIKPSSLLRALSFPDSILIHLFRIKVFIFFGVSYASGCEAKRASKKVLLIPAVQGAPQE
jgi:hypothetical protein